MTARKNSTAAAVRLPRTQLLINHVQGSPASGCRLSELAEVYFGSTDAARNASESAMSDLAGALNRLAREGRVHASGYGTTRRWHSTVQADAVAPPRRTNVMVGTYSPMPDPVLRAGSMDYRAAPSRGFRC